MQFTIELSLDTAVQPSPNVLRVAGMFGLGIDEHRRLNLITPTTLELNPRQIIFITGASGSGKSSLLRLIAQSLAGRDDAQLIRFDAMPELVQQPLVDALSQSYDLPLETVLHLLSLAGLNDAFVMLRKPGELSDGQRYRLRLAQMLAQTQRSEPGRLQVVLADEFGATLDRITAHVIARNIRKWVSRECNICFITATTHDDLLEPLEPDVLIEKHLGEGIEVMTRGKE